MPTFREAMGSDLEKLLEANEDTLLTQMGLRLREAEENLESAARLDGLRIASSYEQGLDLHAAATRVYRRLNKELHAVVCGTAADDVEDRRSILDVTGMGTMVLASAIAQVLVAGFGILPVVATVVAALLVKRIFEPAGEELCAHWASKLD